MRVPRYEFYFTLYADSKIPAQVVNKIGTNIEMEFLEELADLEEAFQSVLDAKVAKWERSQEDFNIDSIVTLCNTSHRETMRQLKCDGLFYF